MLSPAMYSGNHGGRESVQVYILKCCHIWLWLCNARYPMRQQRALLGEIEGDGERKRKMTAHLIIFTVAWQQYPDKSSLFSI